MLWQKRVIRHLIATMELYRSYGESNPNEATSELPFIEDLDGNSRCLRDLSRANYKEFDNFRLDKIVTINPNENAEPPPQKKCFSSGPCSDLPAHW
jgi:hypothetical protein